MESPTKKITIREVTARVAESRYPMNSMGIQLPYAYVAEAIDINWADVLFAIDNGYFDLQVAIEHAVAEVTKNESWPQEIEDLLGLAPYESYAIRPLVEKLVGSAPEHAGGTAKDRIMFVLLRWLFEHKQDYEDPPMLVEIVYADFGYPEEIKFFVRYTPIELFENTTPTGVAGLYKNWKKYLKQKSATFKN